MKRKNLVFALLIGLFLFAFIPVDNQRIVVLDVGHGGKDAGTSAHNAQEKQIVLAVAKKVHKLNEDEDLRILLTRNGDYFLDLEKRAEIIESHDPDVVISLHVDNSERRSPGPRFYIAREDRHGSMKLAQNLKKNLGSMHSKINSTPAFLLKNATSPTVVLELGNLSNEDDLKCLTTEAGQNKIAKSILEAVR